MNFPTRGRRSASVAVIGAEPHTEVMIPGEACPSLSRPSCHVHGGTVWYQTVASVVLSGTNVKGIFGGREPSAHAGVRAEALYRSGRLRMKLQKHSARLGDATLDLIFLRASGQAEQ